ncbi:tetratricopeptide repeat protein [Patescibacteria group bacterium]
MHKLKKGNLLFPYFLSFFNTRKLRAAVYIFIFIILILTLFINVNNYPNISYDFLEVLKKPQDPITHLHLADKYWNIGKSNSALVEINISQRLLDKKPNLVNPSSSVTNILGASSSPVETWKKWHEEPIKLQEDYNYWQEIVDKHPDYRDAYVKTAYYAFLLGKKDKALLLLNKAKTIDPNHTQTQKFIKIVNSY